MLQLFLVSCDLGEEDASSPVVNVSGLINLLVLRSLGPLCCRLTDFGLDVAAAAVTMLFPRLVE